MLCAQTPWMTSLGSSLHPYPLTQGLLFNDLKVFLLRRPPPAPLPMHGEPQPPGLAKWQPTPVFLPGESQGWQSLMGCHLCCQAKRAPRAAFPSGCLAAQTKRWAEGIRVPGEPPDLQQETAGWGELISASCSCQASQ